MNVKFRVAEGLSIWHILFVFSHPGNDAPVIGGRKKKRRSGPAPPVQPPEPAQPPEPTPAELEPGVEWYEDDKCDAPDCKRPKKKKKIPWVTFVFPSCMFAKLRPNIEFIM